jgi:hypothetical protein
MDITQSLKKIVGNDWFWLQVVSTPSPKTGGYFELTKNLADVFENFVNGTTVGAPSWFIS